MYFNEVIMGGNTTREGELRYLPNGTASYTNSVATNRKFKKQDGSLGEEVCFTEFSILGKLAETANQYLGRGVRVLIKGRLKLDQWTNQQGVKCSKHSIFVESFQLIDFADTQGQQPNRSNQSQQRTPASQQPQSNNQSGYSAPTPDYEGHDIPDLDINDDEIPF